RRRLVGGSIRSQNRDFRRGQPFDRLAFGYLFFLNGHVNNADVALRWPKRHDKAKRRGYQGQRQRGAWPEPAAPGSGSLPGVKKQLVAIDGARRWGQGRQRRFKRYEFRIEVFLGHMTPNLSRNVTRPARYQRCAVLDEASINS